ncbi:Peroxisomal acyl-coenzyme A oxidase 1 [Phytophthora cinnamomi]|uniref:Peroxisomal acyl-coenzyme A oxidase 1 n=1 Tax=Phytophthora cinnamomi TaxID=4785 RepID=UPI00355AC139|nr:Peroxisomal acyl-coenzyme A oxidase 1 [Phytophthora cinnamomi]
MAPVSSLPLHDLAPLLLRRERQYSDIDVELLANALRGGREANRRRKLMVELVRHHSVLSRRDFIYQNHAQRCATGLEKAYHYIKLVQDRCIDDPRDQQELYVALGERLPLEVHRAMFIPTLEIQADNEQQAKFAKVLPDGTFIKPKSSKLVYLTMTQGRNEKVAAQGSEGLPAEFQVLDYQNQQHALLPLIALAYAANFAGRAMTTLHDDALTLVKTGHGAFDSQVAEVHAVSSGLKALLADRVNDGIEQCRRLCGGSGFLQSSNLPHLFAENVGACTFEGTFDVLVQQHARYLLKAHARLRHSRNSNGEIEASDDETPTSFLRYTDLYANPRVRCNAHRAADFGNFHVLTDAFEVRAARSIRRLADAMAGSNKDRNTCMLLMTAVSTHHAELMLLKSFISGVYSLPSGKTKAAVAQLCQLFGASLLVKGLGDFRQQDYLSSAQGEMVHKQLQELLPPVRRNAVRLTDSWDFTDFELNSAIGGYDGDIYRALVEQTKREPLNAAEVPKGYEKYLRPLLHSSL